MALILERSKLSAVCLTAGVLAFLIAGFLLVINRWDPIYTAIALVIGVLLSGIAVALNRERAAELLRRRQARYGSNTLILSAAFVGILVVINALALNYPQRLDLTEDKELSLRPETLLLLSELSKPVSIVGFYSPDRSGSRDQMRPILEAYSIESDGLVRYEFIDPNANPLAADSFGYRGDGWMGVTIGDASHVVQYPSEREITSAIVRLSNPENRTVYFLTGHGESELRATDDGGLAQFVQALEFKNYGVESLNLLVEGEIPKDAAVLVAAAPAIALTNQELDRIDDYLRSGGALVAMLEPSLITDLDSEQDSFNQYLRNNWGLSARDDIVIDPQAFYADVGLSFAYGDHPITERIRTFTTQFPSVRSLELDHEVEAKRSIVELVSSSESSWGETDFSALLEGRTTQTEAEAVGPLALAAAVEDSETGARVVLVGDSDFATNGSIYAGGNRDLIVNSVDWAAKLDNLIDITPREQTQRQIVPATMSTVLMLSILVVVVIPGLILLSGAWVWWSRRRHP